MHSFKTFLTNESGTVTVDWAVLTALAATIAIATATVMNAGMNAFTAGTEDELMQMNGQGAALINAGDYTPSDEVLYMAYLSGLEDLSTEELDAIAAFANRASRYGNMNATLEGRRDEGFDLLEERGASSIRDFVAAVDQRYNDLNLARNTRVDVPRGDVESAMSAMGLGSAQQSELLDI